MEVGKGPGGPFGAGLRRVLGWAQGWHLVLEAVARLGGDTRRWHSPGAGWGAPEPELPRGSFTCPVPVLPPRFPPPHPPPRPPPASQIFFFFFFREAAGRRRGCLGGTSMGAEGAGAARARPAPKGRKEKEKGREEKPGSLRSGRAATAPRPPPRGSPQTLGITGSAPPCQPHSFTTHEVLGPPGMPTGAQGVPTAPPPHLGMLGWRGSRIPWSPALARGLGSAKPFFGPKSWLKWEKKKSCLNVSHGGRGDGGGRVAGRRAVAQAHTCSFPTPTAAAPGGKHTGRPRPRESREGHIPLAWHGRAARRPTTPASPPGAPWPSLPGDPVTVGDPPPPACCLSPRDPIAVPPWGPHWGPQLSPWVCYRSLGDPISPADPHCPSMHAACPPVAL